LTKDVRADWEARISNRSDRSASTPATLGIPDLQPPQGVTVVGGVGHVKVTWLPVDGAVGYLVHRAAHAAGPYAPVDHHSGDVLSVPHPPYVDTTGEPGTSYWYAVAVVPEVTVTGSLSLAVEASSLPFSGTPPQVLLTVDVGHAGTTLARPWQPMIGSERLSQLLCEDTSGGRVIGDDLRLALARMRDDIGVQAVRAHAIFHDDTAVYREVDGVPVHDFAIVDRIYDLLLGIKLKPVVEIGFMPKDLASDASRTAFAYHAIVSPPKDYGRWGDLVSAFTRHLIDRYGRDEVVGWDFEVWNEANLEVFWSGTKQEWMHLYDVTAAAVKGVDARIAVGGPSTAAAGWVDDLLVHCRESGSPVDFVSTHTYGSPPLDVRASLLRHGFPDARVLWTEWGVTPRHFNPINDSVFSAVFLISGMRSAAGRIDALSYWVASDHFEELGRPPRLLHGGFGLLTVGNLPKPRFHAMRLLSRLGEREQPVEATGDGAEGLVHCWASRSPSDGRVAVLVWNFTLDQAKWAGDAALTRWITLSLPGIDGTWTMRQSVLKAGSGDVVDAARAQGTSDWPADSAEWGTLAEAAKLPVTETTVTAYGDLTVELRLDMPSAVLVELLPQHGARGAGAV
jgi:xylan 1,4-beta-xylosidase